MPKKLTDEQALNQMAADNFFAAKKREERAEKHRERFRVAVRKGESDGLGIVEMMGLIREVFEEVK